MQSLVGELISHKPSGAAKKKKKKPPNSWFKQGYRVAKAKRKIQQGRKMKRWVERAPREERKMSILLPIPSSLSSKLTPHVKREHRGLKTY